MRPSQGKKIRMPKEPTRIWITIENKDVMDFISLRSVTHDMIAHFCRYNPQLVSEAVQAITTRQMAEQRLAIAPITALQPTPKDEHTIECLLLVDGDTRDIERYINFAKARRLQQECPEMEPTAYAAMKKSAFNLMRKNKIRNFSEEELHRVFKHAKEQLLYTSIVRSAIEDGFTIDSLYEQDRDRGLGR